MLLSLPLPPPAVLPPPATLVKVLFRVARPDPPLKSFNLSLPLLGALPVLLPLEEEVLGLCGWLLLLLLLLVVMLLLLLELTLRAPESESRC